MANDYAIVIPSLDRPQNIRAMLRMFPKAYVTVNESNIHMFREAVPRRQLVPHPDMRLIETRNWILDNFQEECVLQFNDDVRGMRFLADKGSYITRDSAMIRAVIENTLQCARDLGIGVFCWSLTGNSALLKPMIRPYRASAPCSAHAFGVCGASRSRRFSTQFRGCGDFDFTLETLLRDRLLLCDVRWHFDCGGMSRGRGGQTGELRPQEASEGQSELRRKWGQYVGSSKTSQVEQKHTWRAFSVNVKRTSPLGLS